jgi:glycosyltransferase involved in cell wall biosynthesis
MRELSAMGHDCLIITSDSSHLDDQRHSHGSAVRMQMDGQLQICWLRTIGVTKSKSLRRILSWLHFELALLRLRTKELRRPDVVVVSSLSLITILNGLVLRRRFKTRLVFEIRDIWPLTLVEEAGYSRWNPFIIALGIIERLGYRHADAIVGTMPNLGEHVRNVIGYEKPTFCIPMGYSESTALEEAPPADSVVAQYPEIQGFVVTYAGTVGASNALEPMFRAAEELQGTSDVHFVVLGDGGLLPDFKRRFGGLSNVTFIPKVPKHAVQAVLSRADVLYLSMHGTEVTKYGQSLNKLIDYMMAGKPVLASYSGFESMINEAGCGSFVAAGDAHALADEIRRYAAMDEARRRDLGERGRRWVLEHRAFSRLAEDYLPILFPSGTPAHRGHDGAVAEPEGSPKGTRRP